MPVTRAMDAQLNSILAAIEALRESTNIVIADVKESTNAAIAASNESTNIAIADVKESTNIALASTNAAIGKVTSAVEEIKELTAMEIEMVSAKVEAVKESTSAAIADVKESTSAAIADVKESTSAAIADVRESMNTTIRDIEDRIKQLEMKGVPKKEDATNVFDCPTGLEGISAVPATTSGPKVKASVFDGKSAWNVYKTQFDIVAAANGWNDVAKAYNLAASLRGEAADVLLTIPAEDRRPDLTTLTTALELRFGNQHLKDYTRAQLKSRRQRSGESLQELASEIERLSLIAFPDCPADVRDTLALEYFVDAIRDTEIQTRVRLSDAKDLKSAFIFSMKVQSAHLASGKDRRPVRAVTVQDTTGVLERRIRELERLVRFQDPNKRMPRESNFVCWTCKKEGHVRRNCPERDGTSTEEPSLN